MPGLQEWIHKFEEGVGVKYIQWAAALLGVIALAVAYHIREFKSFSAPEAMDTAQLARNISEGKGYTTRFIRPLSMRLLEDHRPDRDPGLRGGHPDLANPPVYPLLLAGLLKVVPVNYAMPNLRSFVRYQPEMYISVLNQCLFLMCLLVVYLFARKFFDTAVAVTSTLAMALTDLFWRFSGSGLSTCLLMLLFLLLIWFLTFLSVDDEAAPGNARRFLVFGFASGVVVGVAGLTRYSLAWLLIPALIYGLMAAGGRRWLAVISMLAGFMVVFSPWVARNYQLSGHPFGTAGYALLEYMDLPIDREYVLEEGRGDFSISGLIRKLLVYGGEIMTGDLLRMNGSWVTAFFLAGLLVPFQKKVLGRVRVFLLLSILLFIGVQAVTQTHLTRRTPMVNSENLLVLFTPMIIVFGVSLYYLFLDQLALVRGRIWVTGLFLMIVSGPLIFTLLPPRSGTVAYPPYWPPVVQQTAEWLEPHETMMSDMPWAVGWYGNRDCLWVTADVDKEFFAIHDFLKPISGLYFTGVTTDAKFFSEMLRESPRGYGEMVKQGAKSWEGFALVAMTRGDVPTGFPLKLAGPRLLPDQLFLTDRERWRGGGY